VEAVAEDAILPTALPAGTPAAARQPLQGRKKDK
jgi:hypothetical protein